MAKKIMIIRHAEKPTKDDEAGILYNGKQSEDSLTVKGWQRAGALAQFFRNATANIDTPTELYSCSLYNDHHALRCLETITPLADSLNIQVHTTIPRGDEAKMAILAKESDGIVLICWEHSVIHLIANNIVDCELVPQDWPGERFDMVYVFDLQPDHSYKFTQVPQMALKGDGSELFNIS